MRQDLAHLLRTRRFVPLFVTQFLGAFNDNQFKNALVILILYRLSERIAIDGGILVTLAAGIFILPFFLFSALAGQLADKFEKSRQIRLVKLCEILIMVLAVIGFISGGPYLLIGILFLMGTQSAFFGPLKYAILPDHLKPGELIGGNAFVEAGTFLAILLGTIGGGLIILTAHGIAIISISIVLTALAGYLASRAIPEAAPPSPELKLNLNIAAETWILVREALAPREMRLTILGISWFWLVGATFLAQFPALVKIGLGADQQVVTLFLTIFSVGIGIGSLLCNRLLDGEISARYVPLAMFSMTLFILDFYFSLRGFIIAPGPLTGAAGFLSQMQGWRIVVDLLAISIAGGVYIVPLYALMQARSRKIARARTIAANNILNALFMAAGAAVAAAMMAAGLSIPVIFLLLGVLNAGAAFLMSGLSA
ncbi:MAG: hypothetical protein C0605_08315 [Hyphomicrobiales bacterium]|nr:MAG: hypothetical protein C0605_08315 [Hyphomicrobiales bacterium]